MLVKSRLTEQVERKIIPPNSFAYRKNKSAPMCLNQTLHLIESLRKEKKKVFVCILDIDNAYNCVSTSKLLNVMHHNRLNPAINNWIQNFLSKRILMLGNHSVTVQDGLPQGSCLSPILFNIYTSGFHDLNDHMTQVLQYADDIIIVSHDSCVLTALKNLKNKLTEFQSQCKSLNLSLNFNKTKFMYITKGPRKTFNLSVSSNNVEQVFEIRILGRMVNSNLSIREHVKKVKKEVTTLST